MLKRSPYKLSYRFEFPDGRSTDFDLALDTERLCLVPFEREHLPDWTNLTFCQCRCCPLNADEHPRCPIAVNIVELVATFKNIFSYQECTLHCVTAEREYVKQTSVMEGLSTIFGVIMATSDCPVMAFLKPMARFHLPFATIEETTVRSTSLYLLGRYLKYKDQPEKIVDFKPLEQHYARVQVVNEGLLNRITSLGSEDADKNAIVTLHSLSQFLSMEIDYNLSALEHIFENAGIE